LFVFVVRPADQEGVDPMNPIYRRLDVAAMRIIRIAQ